jgi:hypothetical protein
MNIIYIYIYTHISFFQFNHQLFSQDYGQHNHLEWVCNHSHFYLSFKYSFITYWVILISVSFHPRQRGTEGLVIHPFSKHPNAPLFITIWKPLVHVPNDVPQVLNAFPKGVPNNTTLSSWVHVESSHWLRILYLWKNINQHFWLELIILLLPKVYLFI